MNINLSVMVKPSSSPTGFFQGVGNVGLIRESTRHLDFYE